MPYTLSHPAFALPLRRLGLPVAALVIGSLTPDVPLWADAAGVGPALRSVGVTYAFTHSPVGVLTACLLSGLMLWAWWLLVQRPLLDTLPAQWRGPAVTRPRPRTDLRAVSGGIAGIWVGAATHVLIDEFTHEGRWAHTTLAWFAADHAGLDGVHWVQYIGSLGGGLVMVSAVLIWLSRHKRAASREALVPEQTSRRLRQRRRIMRCTLVGGGVLAAGYSLTALATQSFAAAVFHTLTVGVLLCALGASLGAVLWHLLAGRDGNVASSEPVPLT